MKKVCLALLAILLILSLCACGKTAKPSAEENAALEAEMKALFDQNIFCVLNVFEQGYLPFEDEPYKDDRYCRVTDSRFQTFDQFETYVKGVYAAEEADRLLNLARLDDNTLYREIDGYLCIDRMQIGGRGYFVEWDGYTLAIDEVSESECTFTVTAAITEPAEVPVAEPYTRTAKALKQDGKWLLEKMIY